MLLTSACTLFQPAQKAEEPVVVDKTEETGPRIDTIELTQLSDQEYAPILERTPDLVTERKETYNILLAGPFGSSQSQFGSNRLNARSQRLLNFYLGFKYAILQNEGSSIINLDVFDTDNVDLTDDILNSTPAFREADLFVGPYFSDNLRALTDFAAEKGRVVISPWNSILGVKEKPNYIQMRPSLQRHCQELTEFAHTRHADDEILIITSNHESDRAIREHIQSVSTAPRLHEFIISDLNDPTLNDQFLSIWETDSIRGIILPAWSDEAFVVSILSKINFAKGDRKISVYGLPQWMEMERMDFDILENLEVFVSATRPLPRKDEQSRVLVQYFFDNYGSLPDDEVMYGADMAWWLGGMLSKEGSLITSGLSNPEVPGVRQQFDFIAKYGDDREQVDYFSNDYITVYKFEDYQFSPVKGVER